MLRRHLWRWATVAALALVASAAALPATSSAATAEAAIARCAGVPGARCVVPLRPATAGLNHVGWTYLNLNYCAPGMACIALYRDSMAAWSWSGSAWRATSIRQGWAYVYPYTGSWRWAWTQDTGWVAVSGGRFELRGY
jgi:hypothetical protein